MGLVAGALPLYATQCASYLQVVFPSLNPKITALCLLTFFYVINVLGIELAASVQGIMVLVLIAALITFGVCGIPAIDTSNFEPLFTKGTGGFIIAVCLLTFALQGSNSVIELGAEIKEPGRNIPFSLLISIPVVCVIYIMVSVSAIGGINLDTWMAVENANLLQPAKVFMSRPLFIFFLVGGALFAFATTLNGTFMWATKSLMVVAKDQIMPPVLAKTNKRGTPVIFLTVLWALSFLCVIIDAGIETFASYATMGGMIVFIPSMIAAILLPKKAPELYKIEGFRLRGPLLYIAPVIGIISSILLIVILMVDLSWMALPFVGWLFAGIVFYLVRKRGFEKKTGGLFAEYVEEDFKKMIKDCKNTIKRTDK